MLGSFDLNGDTLGSYQRIQKSENHVKPYTQELFFYTTQRGSRQSWLIDHLLAIGIIKCCLFHSQ